MHEKGKERADYYNAGVSRPEASGSQSAQPDGPTSSSKGVLPEYAPTSDGTDLTDLLSEEGELSSPSIITVD